MAQQHNKYISPRADGFELKPLSLADKDLFDRFLGQYPVGISEYTFTNLFIWNSYYHFKYMMLDDALLVFSAPDHKPWVLFPPLGGNDPVCTARKGFELLSRWGMDPVMERVPQEMALKFSNGDPEFEIFLDRDQSDYVYLRRDLVELKGRGYHAKRNHLNKFYRIYDGRYVRIKKEMYHEVLNLQEQWCNIRSCEDDPGLLSEDRALRTAFENMDRLDFVAGAVVVGGKIQAFSLGGRLTNDTAVIHLEKANPDIEGIYQAINQQFALFELSGYKYINREQDMGDPSLRKAKLSYHPDHLVKKYRVAWRG